MSANESLYSTMCARVREQEWETERATQTEIAWYSARAQPPHYREWREVLLCALYKAWAETPSLSKYYYRQQFPTEFNVETQRVRLGDHTPASHLKTSFHSHPLQPAHPPWSLQRADHLYKKLSLKYEHFLYCRYDSVGYSRKSQLMSKSFLQDIS